MRKLNHQFEAQVWYDPEEKKPPMNTSILFVIEDNNDLNVLTIEEGMFREVLTDQPPTFTTRRGKLIPGKVLAWTAWSPEYLFEPVDVHAPIRGIVKESNRGGKNVWN